MVNRSSLHGSFRDHSPERRVTMVLGFHKRASAVGTTTTNVRAFRLPGGGNSKSITYSEDDVLRRARMIPLAIDARRSRFPHETPYVYQGAQARRRDRAGPGQVPGHRVAQLGGAAVRSVRSAPDVGTSASARSSAARQRRRGNPW